MKLYDMVYILLEKHPELRSSDKKLMWTVWFKQKLAIDTIGKWDFVTKAIAPESITRARRKVQEDHPELKAKVSVQQEREYKEDSKGQFINEIRL